MKRWMPWASVLVLVWGLWGCASTGGMGREDSTVSASQRQEPDVFPGGWWNYSWGYGQTFENFANVEIAQSEYSPHRDVRWWGADGPSQSSGATMLSLTAYWPLHVRWRLKDGREYILENIDMRTIMRDYFKAHSIELQWQKERRRFESASDYEPTLVHQVKNNTVLIEWVITTNTTAVKNRFLPSGAATQWNLTHERYLVTTLKGNPTSGLDFSKTRVLLSPASIVHP